MKNLIIASISTVGILAAGVAFAQTATFTGTNNAASLSESGSAAVAVSEAFSNGYTDNSVNTSDVDTPAIAPNLAGLYASPHTCMGSATASAGIGGVFSAGVGSTYQDNECNKREAVKLAAQLGLKGAAAAVFYDIEVVRNVVGEAQNAGEVARREAAQLAGVAMAAPATSTTTTTRPVAAPAGTVAAGSSAMNVSEPPSAGAPWWCANAKPNNARWSECVQ